MEIMESVCVKRAQARADDYNVFIVITSRLDAH